MDKQNMPSVTRERATLFLLSADRLGQGVGAPHEHVRALPWASRNPHNS